MKPENVLQMAVRDPDTECWEWTGVRANGYGRGTFPGLSHLAYRSIYLILVGPIPDGLQLDHLCRNRGCVNPRHLEPVTPRENQRRGAGLIAKQLARTHCPKGHPYAGDNLYVCPRGTRRCNECNRQRSRDFWARKRAA